MNRCGMKNWKPVMDDQGSTVDFHHAISAAMSTRTLSGFSDLEDVLLTADHMSGACVKQKQRFRESPILQSLRSDRRRAQTVEERKPLTFMIQTKHKQELQTCNTLKMNELLSQKRFPIYKKQTTKEWQDIWRRTGLQTCWNNYWLGIQVVSCRRLC